MLIGTLLYSSASYSGVHDLPNVIDNLPDFEFNNMKLGDNLSTVFFDKYCPAALKDSAEIECKQKTELSGINLSILYFFYNKKLLAISFNFPSSNYNDLIDIYTEKFSQSPHSNSEEPLLLNTETKYINEKSSWNTTSGEFVIAKYWNNVKKGSAHIMSNDYEKYKVDKREKLNEGIFKRIYRAIFD
ncbi:MAG: hypothetical protein HND53_11760 [Proteobacteria bacterium]|nr:hypothetical protein [Pseudomonadota bacterium]NOG61169.1 hypothetical protein [Pseudomonadota bacterium]